jgi:voltage-gated potassium channel
MKNHIVIVGFGVKGQAALRSLLAHKQKPNDIVVIAEDRYSVAEATRRGVTGVVGDARNEQVLLDAGVPSASKVIIAADQDDTAIMVTLRVRALAPAATIVAAAREASAGELLRQSGADRVITHAESAGNLMGLSLLSGNVGAMLEDLMDTGRGLEFVERDISRAELGLAPSDVQAEGELVLAVVRDGQVHRFDEGRVKVFQKDDRVVVIRPSGRPSAVQGSPGSGSAGASSSPAQPPAARGSSASGSPASAGGRPTQPGRAAGSPLPGRDVVDPRGRADQQGGRGAAGTGR